MENGFDPLCEIKMFVLCLFIVLFIFLLADYAMTKERVWYLESVVEKHWDYIESRSYGPKG